jgi:hypothetical protein
MQHQDESLATLMAFLSDPVNHPVSELALAGSHDLRSLHAENVYRQHIPPAAHLIWAGADWTSQAIKHTQLDTVHMLAQLQKFTVTQSELAEPR